MRILCFGLGLSLSIRAEVDDAGTPSTQHKDLVSDQGPAHSPGSGSRRDTVSARLGAQSAELIGAFKQYQTLNKRCTRAGSSPPAAAKL